MVRKRRQIKSEESDDSGDNAISATTAGHASSNASTAAVTINQALSISELERSELQGPVADMAQAILALNCVKGSIKDNDLKKCFPNTNKERRRAIVAKVGPLLERAFAIEIVFPDPTDANCRYYLKAPGNTAANNFLSENALSKQGLLIVLLAYLFMAKNPLLNDSYVEEDDIWRFLDKLGISRNREHQQFGDVKKLIGGTVHAEFISQGWLEPKKVAMEGDVKMTYAWGPRACRLLNRYDVLKMASLILMNTVDEEALKSWPYHYEKAVGPPSNE